MALQWVPPHPGVLKINVHGHNSPTPLPNGNSSRICAIYRTSDGQMKLLSTGVMHGLTPLGNQLWAMYSSLRRASVQGYRNIRLETDNYEAYKLIKNFNVGAPAGVFDIVDQLDTLIHDKNWRCIVSYVFPGRNRVARFLAKLGMEACDQLYSMDMHVGGVEELLDWDLGLGLDHPNYLDVFIPAGAPDPVNFDISMSLANQVNDLGLGQIGAPRVARVETEVHEQTAILKGADEGFFCGAGYGEELLFADEPPLGDLD